MNPMRLYILLSIVFLQIVIPHHVWAETQNKKLQDKVMVSRKALLEKEITFAKKKAKALWAASYKITDIPLLGTAYSSVGVEEGICYSLGLMLGQDQAVKDLEFGEKAIYNWITSEEKDDKAFTMQLKAHSLGNFIHVAKDIVNKTHDERVIQWNLDCSGKMGIPKIYIKQSVAQTFYQVKNRGAILQVLGNIEIGFSDKIIAAIKRNPKVKTIALGSGGGVLYEALRAGLFIRSKNLDTTLWNNCYSACPLVFIAGKHRRIWSPYYSLGFHQVYSNNGAEPLNSQVYKDISAYSEMMGVNSKFILTNMQRAQPKDMNTIYGSNEVLCKEQVATWIQRLCSADNPKTWNLD